MPITRRHGALYWKTQILRFKTTTQEVAEKITSMYKVQMREWAAIDFLIDRNFTIDDFRELLAHEPEGE